MKSDFGGVHYSGGFAREYLMGTRFEIEKFDERMNFGLWQVQVKDVLIQSGLQNKRFKKIICGTSSVGSFKRNAANVVSQNEGDVFSL